MFNLQNSRHFDVIVFIISFIKNEAILYTNYIMTRRTGYSCTKQQQYNLLRNHKSTFFSSENIFKTLQQFLFPMPQMLLRKSPRDAHNSFLRYWKVAPCILLSIKFWQDQQPALVPSFKLLIIYMFEELGNNLMKQVKYTGVSRALPDI